MRSVRFLKSHGIYNAGEAASFPGVDAALLVKLGVAEYREKPQASALEAAEKAATAKRGRVPLITK